MEIYFIANSVLLCFKQIPEDSTLSEEVVDLIFKCLVKNPKYRINIEDIFDHNFFKYDRDYRRECSSAYDSGMCTGSTHSANTRLQSSQERYSSGYDSQKLPEYDCYVNDNFHPPAKIRSWFVLRYLQDL